LLKNKYAAKDEHADIGAVVNKYPARKKCRQKRKNSHVMNKYPVKKRCQKRNNVHMHGYRQKKNTVGLCFETEPQLRLRSKPAMMRRKPGDRRATWLTWWCRPVTGTRLIAFRESRGRGAHQVASQAIPIQTLNNGASRPRSRRRLALTRPTRTRRRALSSSVFFPAPSFYI
jgi:hypothetical protein